MSDSNKSSDLLNVSGKKKTIEDLINASSTTNTKSINDIPSLTSSAGGERKTFSMGPSSDILSRVQAFLPQMQQANEQLQTLDPKKLDIENVEEEDGQYIEMNLGLGVYKEKKPGQSDSEDDEDDSEDEKLVIPNNAPADVSKKHIIEMMEE